MEVFPFLMLILFGFIILSESLEVQRVQKFRTFKEPKTQIKQIKKRDVEFESEESEMEREAREVPKLVNPNHEDNLTETPIKPAKSETENDTKADPEKGRYMQLDGKNKVSETNVKSKPADHSPDSGGGSGDQGEFDGTTNDGSSGSGYVKPDHGASVLYHGSKEYGAVCYNNTEIQAIQRKKGITLEEKRKQLNAGACDRRKLLACVTKVGAAGEGGTEGDESDQKLSSLCECAKATGPEGVYVKSTSSCHIPAGVGWNSECFAREHGFPLPSGDPWDWKRWNRMFPTCVPHAICRTGRNYIGKKCQCKTTAFLVQDEKGNRLGICEAASDASTNSPLVLALILVNYEIIAEMVITFINTFKWFQTSRITYNLLTIS